MIKTRIVLLMVLFFSSFLFAGRNIALPDGLSWNNTRNDVINMISGLAVNPDNQNMLFVREKLYDDQHSQSLVTYEFTGDFMRVIEIQSKGTLAESLRIIVVDFIKKLHYMKQDGEAKNINLTQYYNINSFTSVVVFIEDEKTFCVIRMEVIRGSYGEHAVDAIGVYYNKNNGTKDTIQKIKDSFAPPPVSTWFVKFKE